MRDIMTRVAIVARHPIVRRGIESILTGPDFTVVASVARLAELADPGGAEVVLLGPCDVEPAAAIGRLCARARVLLVCAPAAAADVLAAIRAGAGGYLTEHTEEAVIRSAARTVAAGGFAVSADLAGILHSGLAPDPPERAGPEPAPPRPAPLDSALSPREREALCWIAKGLTHAQTATRMRVSKPTVDTYVARARAKLRLGNKADLTRAALAMDGTLSLAG